MRCHQPHFSVPFLSVSFLPVITLIVTLGFATCQAVEPSASIRLHTLFESEWQRKLRDDPVHASFLGDARFNHLWQDASVEAVRARADAQRKALWKLAKINVEQLTAVDKLNLTLFRKEYQTDIREFTEQWHLIPLNQRGGIQTANEVSDSLPFETIKHYEDWIARLKAFPTYMDQTLELMRLGVKAGRVHPQVVMRRVPAQIKRQIVDDPTDSLFFKPFRSMPKAIASTQQARLKSEAQTAIRQQVVPAYRKMQTFFADEYLPACFPRVGIWQMQNGQQLYASQARKFTTTDLTPAEIHDIGQREVRRIRAEMVGVIKQLEFNGSFDEFLEHLRTDPKFYYKNPNDLIAAYRAFCKRVDPQLPKLFKRLPRIPYGIESIPLNIAPDTTTAYYRPPSSDGRRPGTYFVNLYKPEVRPKYEIAALSLHESVPGHHLQIALAMELGNLPAFRRYGGYTAYIEAWALYSEKLGEVLGVYDDPYSKFGQLTYEMWRAVRLVVDTGMHSMKWSRQQAIDFFAANTAKTLHDIENEIDRYIAWPGQALAYKIGELKIRELRALSERKLGERFDVKEFHDVVLRQGAVPLDVLEEIVKAWLASTK